MEKKKRVENLLEYAAIYLVLVIFWGLFFWLIFDRLKAFAVIPRAVPMYTVVVCASLCALIIEFLIVKRKSFAQRMRGLVWVAAHMNVLILCIVLPSITIASLEAEITASIDDLKDIISISWMMFSIAVAIFVVWNGLIYKYLAGKEPKFDAYDRHEELQKMLDKTMFYEKVNKHFVSADLIIVTLVVLLSSTVLVYMETKGVTLLNQNATRCSFYFCSVFVLLLFIDVIKPIKEERNALLAKAKISNEEIEKQAREEENRCTARKFMEMIDGMSGIEKSEKEHMKKSVYNYYLADNEQD